MSERTTKLRCAVYTRKSTDEGLDQAFNSLDAQREACEAYITSQAGLGWRLVKDRYDDGGLSGGTMERPALQRLLDEVRQGRVDVIVVYKIDRLTRSLMDFARMVEIFDGAKVSFVSVTQQFNTTTSMGRLTLNVLLSFAQFEREVTAERIRDKIAASKRKGIWMGGTVPFGYRVANRKLVADPTEAAEVRRLFERYLELGSVKALASELNAAVEEEGTDGGSACSPLLRRPAFGLDQRPRRIGRGQLHYLLTNPVYIGRIRHRDMMHAGEHEGIVGEDLFAAVQARLVEQAPSPRSKRRQRDIHLLTGLLFDAAGRRIGPSHATKAGKRYRYYVAASVETAAEGGREDAADGAGGGTAAFEARMATAAKNSTGTRRNKTQLRLPAAELEAVVFDQLRALSLDRVQIARWLEATGDGQRIEQAIEKGAQVARQLSEVGAIAKRRQILTSIVTRIEIGTKELKLTIDKAALCSLLADAGAASNGKAAAATRTFGPNGSTASAGHPDPRDLHIIAVPFKQRRRGVERRLVVEASTLSLARYDQGLIEIVAKAHAFRNALTDGQGRSRQTIADQLGARVEDISRLLPLAFLSPRIVDAIFAGRQPVDLTAQRLSRGLDLPIRWDEQETLLGF